MVYVTRGAGLDDPIIEATVEPGIAGGADTGATVTTLHKDGHLGHLDRPQENPTTAVATGETVILTGLAHPLAAGDRFRLTLRLKSGTKLDVDVTVAQRQPI